MGDFAYSYHTFMLPFLWSTELKTLDDFERQLARTGELRWTRVRKDAHKTTDPEYYSQLQYFKKDAANILLYSGVAHLVRHYRLETQTHNYSRSANGQAKGQYRITKTYKLEKEADNDPDEYETVCYELEVNQIKLSVFYTGVALLSLELENWGDKTVTHPDGSVTRESSANPDDVNAINEFGRRVAFPFIPNAPENGLTADQIVISLCGQTFEENFAETLTQLQQGKRELRSYFVMKPICQILAPDGRLTTDYREAADKKKYFIEPIIDDRMYVCCLVADAELSKELHQKDSDGESIVFSDEKFYKLGFIECDCSCPTLRMRKEIMHRCVYDRWIDYNFKSKKDPEYESGYSGTVDIITHHSLVRLTSPGAGPVINAFLSQYVLMASLALVQRATLIALENQCVAQKPEDIVKLQEKYANAHNDILLDACTVQEQGVEEFHKLQEELFVHEQMDSLEKRLQGLYEVANLHHGRVQENWTTALTWVGIALALVETASIILDWIFP